jgi:hypothetical protein
MEIMRGSGEMWFRLPRPLKKQIAEIAAFYGETQSGVVCRAIEYYFSESLGLAPVEKAPHLP